LWGLQKRAYRSYVSELEIVSLRSDWLKLGKLFLIEIAVVLVVLIVVVSVVAVTPALSGKKNTLPIGAYNQKLFVEDTIPIAKGQAFSERFDYFSYEPAILVIDLTFSGVVSDGTLGLQCNGRSIGIVNASSTSRQSEISVFTFSGTEWVKGPSTYSDAFTNQIIFYSSPSEGFEGTFNVQISIKGSR
jgi:hypothetical protein